MNIEMRIVAALKAAFGAENVLQRADDPTRIGIDIADEGFVSIQLTRIYTASVPVPPETYAFGCNQSQAAQ